ncbi:unnamed protein product [Oikopleura dioica]|uniref:Uncharacterized protein n=1 Tax=Oikopleura dioica TaxID=34765 RepID=E4YBP8_OIKDI|nr:unnamed protein product [Oikopleura dioica]
MPRNNGGRFFTPEPFRPDMVRPFFNEDQKPNVVASHFVASEELFDYIPDAFTFTILKSLPSLYVSTFDYLKNLTTAFATAKNIDNFYSTPEVFFNPGTPFNVYTRNHMAYNLGFDSNSTDSEYFQKAIERIENRFDVVLISDYFFESLILLQDNLRLTHDEVVTLISVLKKSKNPERERVASSKS